MGILVDMLRYLFSTFLSTISMFWPNFIFLKQWYDNKIFLLYLTKFLYFVCYEYLKEKMTFLVKMYQFKLKSLPLAVTKLMMIIIIFIWKKKLKKKRYQISKQTNKQKMDIYSNNIFDDIWILRRLTVYYCHFS